MGKDPEREVVPSRRSRDEGTSKQAEGSLYPLHNRGKLPVRTRTRTLFLEDGTDVNAWMVREGHAFAYRYYGRQYERDEWIAKRKGINIHSGDVMEPWEWRRRRRYAETEGWVPTRQ